jgi:hypothetical protein
MVTCEKADTLSQQVIPPFLFRLVDFMNGLDKWNGSASDLLVEMTDMDTPVNTVTKLLNQYHNSVLAENGITYEYKRTGKSRIIWLTKCDGYDSCDSSIPAEKELSQPSSAVTNASIIRGFGVSHATFFTCKT